MLLHNPPSKINKYLLLPSVPTPNGKLHLGHIGGPYLSADIFARHAQLLGHQAQIIAGTDSYESFVTARALTEQKTPSEICHYYHGLISQDLAIFNIQVSEMINPLDNRWQHHYLDWHNHIFESLIQNNATSYLLEKILWNQQEQRYTTGCWLNGFCPECHGEVTGYFCEMCGAHFRPEEVNLAHDRNSNHHLINEKNNNLFMHLPNDYHLQEKGINPIIENTYHHFLQKQKRLFRLTANSAWGLPIPSNYSLPRSTLFNYGLMFAYFLLMGEVSGQLNGSHKNAFAHDSDIITICTFGIDNAVPFLASILGISSHCPLYKPFDYYFVNYFYHLNGRKFSTSRDHAIWATDIIKQKNAQSDLVRLFLALIDVRHHVGNFDTEQFVQFYNNNIYFLQDYIIKPLNTLKKPENNVIDNQIIERLNHFLMKQHHALQENHYMPHMAAKFVLIWQETMKSYDRNNSQYFWLIKGFILIAYPFMPELCEKIWHALGYEGKPIIYYFDLIPSNSLHELSHLKMTALSSNQLINNNPIQKISIKKTNTDSRKKLSCC